MKPAGTRTNILSYFFYLAIGIFLLSSSSLLRAQGQSEAVDWSKYQMLLGDWQGEATGNPGQGTGSFSFYYDLQKRVLVRKAHNDFPAAQNRPAFSHDDLTIVFKESGQPVKAVYFDNEGHVINYFADVDSLNNNIVFTSQASVSMPRFRLTYTKLGDNELNIKFEIATTGDPNGFVTYVEGKCRRK